MLTDIEKEKIKLEEEYREELKKGKEEKKPDEKTFYDKVDGPLKLLQGVAIAAGIFATIFQYVSNSRSERAEARREYQKSFYEAQMSVYAEAVSFTATLSTATPDSAEYVEARGKFLQLFWGRMSMFEDKCVEAKMVEFKMLLNKFEQKDYKPVIFKDPCSSLVCTFGFVDQKILEKSSLRLAHACRIYTIKTWLPEKEQLKYNLIDTFGCQTK